MPNPLHNVKRLCARLPDGIQQSPCADPPLPHASLRSNDRVELDKCLRECLLAGQARGLQRPEAKLLLLGALPPRDRLRLLGFHLADAHVKRGFAEDNAPELRLTAEYFNDTR